MTFNALFSLYLLACASSTLASFIQIRSSPITVPLAANINHNGGALALLERDRARAKARLAHRWPDVPVPLTHGSVAYTANVSVGAGTYTLIIDTGSSNTWVGGNKTYQPGPNSHDTGEDTGVSYGSGNFTGKEFTDDVTLGSVRINNQSIGVASTSFGFHGFDGILGLGPTDLTVNTTSSRKSIPTVTDVKVLLSPPILTLTPALSQNLASQGVIDSSVVGISFIPTTSNSTKQDGELNFGAADSNKFTGDIAFVPRTTTSPASRYWGVDQNITYGSSNTPILTSSSGIVDTGTTLILLATDGFRAYQNATGATLDKNTTLLRVDSVDQLESLFFHIGYNTYELTPNAQIWPRALNTVIGGDANGTYLIVADLLSSSGLGLDFVNGFGFLQRFYTVYDSTNSQIGFATTSHTFDTTN